MRTRTKPGETMTRRLAEREQRAKAALTKIAEQRQAARDRSTGKSKAQAYVKTWLENLTATELRHECEIRDYLYDDFEGMEDAISTVVTAMFSGVVAQEPAENGTGHDEAE